MFIIKLRYYYYVILFMEFLYAMVYYSLFLVDFWLVVGLFKGGCIRVNYIFEMYPFL